MVITTIEESQETNADSVHDFTTHKTTNLCKKPKGKNSMSATNKEDSSGRIILI
jgi:hypothetical protein